MSQGTKTSGAQGNGHAKGYSTTEFGQVIELDRWRKVGESPKGPGWKQPKTKIRDEAMSDQNSEMTDLKIANAELRISGDIKELKGIVGQLVTSVESLSQGVQEVKTEMGEVKSDNKNTRTTIIVTVIAATLTTIGLIVAIQATLLQAFESGKSSPPPSIEKPIDGTR